MFDKFLSIIYLKSWKNYTIIKLEKFCCARRPCKGCVFFTFFVLKHSLLQTYIYDACGNENPVSFIAR